MKEEPSPQQPTRKKKAKKKTNIDLAAQLFAGPPQARDLVGVAGSVETAPPPTESPWAAPPVQAEDPPLPSKPPQLPSPVRPRQNSWNPAEDPPLPEPNHQTPPPEPIPSSIYEPPPQQKEEPKKTGVVIWFSPVKNQGFLKPDDGSPDVWVHGDGVRPGVAIKKDDRVSYREEVYGRQNRLKAVDVGKYRPAQRPRRPTASLRAPPPQFDAALERALAESADAYAHHQAPPTANVEDDELQRALKASADEFADEQRRRAAQAAPPPTPQYAAPAPQYDPPYVPPDPPRRFDVANPPHANGYAHVDDDLARALAASREAEEIDARRRRDLAAAEERLRAARLAAAPPAMTPPAMAPPGLPPGFGVSTAPPGLPPGLAGFPAAPKLPRDPLAAFLDGAGMGRYLGLFRDEEIRTLEDFRLLTAQDLHDIGLPPHDAAVLHQRTAAHYLANGL